MWHVFINSRFKACPRLLPVVNAAHQQFSKLRVEQAGIDSWRATRIRQRAFCCGARNEDRRWCYEHIAAVGARAEMLRIRNEATEIFVGALFHYMVDYDLDGMIDGFVAGTWTRELAKRNKQAMLVIAPFETPSRSSRAALTEEGERLLRWVEPDAQTFAVRFGE